MKKIMFKTGLLIFIMLLYSIKLYSQDTITNIFSANGKVYKEITIKTIKTINDSNILPKIEYKSQSIECDNVEIPYYLSQNEVGKLINNRTFIHRQSTISLKSQDDIKLTLKDNQGDCGLFIETEPYIAVEIFIIFFAFIVFFFVLAFKIKTNLPLKLFLVLIHLLIITSIVFVVFCTIKYQMSSYTDVVYISLNTYSLCDNYGLCSITGIIYIFCCISFISSFLICLGKKSKKHKSTEIVSGNIKSEREKVLKESNPVNQVKQGWLGKFRRWLAEE